MKIISLCICFFLTLFSFSSASLSRRRRKHSLVNEQLPFIPPVPSVPSDFDTFSGSLSFGSDPFTAVDFSDDAVINRLKIYIENDDPVAAFCELKGNKAAANLKVFNGIANQLFDILFTHETFPSNHSTPVDLFNSFLSIFIKFGVDVTQAQLFNNSITRDMIFKKLISHPRPLLAFFILLQDYMLIKQVIRNENVNFYTTHNAILMLPDLQTKIEVLVMLYNRLGADILTKHKIPRRLFRDTPEIEISRFIVSRGFDPLSDSSLFTRCRLHRHHPKWDYFVEIYGYQAVYAFFDSKPQNSDEPKMKLPFVLYPLNCAYHPRWAVYSRAYGKELVQSYRKQQNI